MVTDNCSLVTVKKPHWRRTQQVYEVLNQAPQEATYDRLIEYVRIQTGKGCSRKLISKWKKTVIRSVNGDPLFVTSKSTNKSKSTKNHQDEPFESHTNVIAVAISCDHNPVDLTPTQIIPAINQTEPEPIQKVKLVESQANSTTIDHQNNKDEDKPKIAHQTLLLTKNELTDDCPLTTQSDVTDNLQVQSCTKRSPEVRFQREQTNNSKNDSSLITNNCSPITDDYLPPVSEKETTANCSLATDNCKSNWSLKKSLFTATAIFVGIVGCSWFFSKDNSKPVIAQPTAVESIQNSELNSQNTSLDSKTAPIQNREVQNQEVQNRRVQNRRVQNGIPRTFKISLTVTSPQDLKVKPGDEITLGQVLSARRRRTFGERTTERQRLLAQKKQLEISLKKLDLPIPELTQPKPIPALSKLPPVSYQQEEANIALKQQELAEAERAIANQEIKIKELE